MALHDLFGIHRWIFIFIHRWILNALLDQINVELTAVGKTKRTRTKPNQMEKSSQLTAEMIQGKFEKLA